MCKHAHTHTHTLMTKGIQPYPQYFCSPHPPPPPHPAPHLPVTAPCHRYWQYSCTVQYVNDGWIGPALPSVFPHVVAPYAPMGQWWQNGSSLTISVSSCCSPLSLLSFHTQESSKCTKMAIIVVFTSRSGNSIVSPTMQRKWRENSKLIGHHMTTAWLVWVSEFIKFI